MTPYPDSYSGDPRIWDVGTLHRPSHLLNCRVSTTCRITIGILGAERVTDQNIDALKLKSSLKLNFLRCEIRYSKPACRAIGRAPILK